MDVHEHHRRDGQFGSHGTASLRQDIVNSLNASPRAAAYWIYPVAADPSWWGRSVSASMDARTTTTDLVPMLVLGLLVGSFLNVLVYRLPIMLERQWQREAQEMLELPITPHERFDLWLPASRCPHCAQPAGA